MTDDELRGLIRAAIQRHLGSGPLDRPAPEPAAAADNASHRVYSISFAQYPIERAADDTMCIIEPAVRCNHCGFCKCHGH